ncbi:MAG TPA: Uma2 family endonuclease [Methylomirabilota bacterium]|nr:Uma2 family endonuclease [Methylomirabilota bacterium]
MSLGHYEEILEGETFLRKKPDARHEVICARLHELVQTTLSNMPAAKLLPPRSIVELTPGTLVRPDLAIVTTATNKLWLVGEVISALDHRIDTVNKKSLYEESRLARLWMIDPRYDNVEVYHGTPFGMSLRSILAVEERLVEPLLPALSVEMRELFKEV